MQSVKWVYKKFVGKFYGISQYCWCPCFEHFRVLQTIWCVKPLLWSSLELCNIDGLKGHVVLHWFERTETKLETYENSTQVLVFSWAMTRQNQQNECSPSEDSDQPGHPPSLIRVFAVRMKKPCVLSYPLSAKRRLWSDWADVQAYLSLRWAHTHFVGFVISWLSCLWCWLPTFLRLHKDHLWLCKQLQWRVRAVTQSQAEADPRQQEEEKISNINTCKINIQMYEIKSL